MASRKKLRKKFFDGKIKLEDLTEDEAKYLSKYISKMERDIKVGKDYGLPTFKEVDCQKLVGKKVLVPVDAKIVDENGWLYLNEPDADNLIVSDAWRRQKAVETEAQRRDMRDLARKQKELEDSAVKELKPTQLGEE